MMKPTPGKNHYPSYYRVINYFDRILTALCEMYLHQHHCIFLSPSESLFPLYKRFLGLNRDREQEAEIAGPHLRWAISMTVFKDGDNRDLEGEALRCAKDYLKVVGDAVAVETAIIVVRFPISE